MNQKRFVLPFCLIILFVLVLKPIPAVACSCAMMPSPEQGLLDAQSVFSGEVINIKESSGLLGDYGKTVLFAVQETWKGPNEMEVKILTGSGGGDCGVAFVVGQEYLVYANQSDMYKEKSLSTNICSPTKELGTASKDIAVLGQGRVPMDDAVPIDNRRTTYLIIGGAVFVAVSVMIFGWMRFQKAKS